MGEYQGAALESPFPWLVTPRFRGMAVLTFPGTQHLAADGIKAGWSFSRARDTGKSLHEDLDLDTE